MATRWPPAEPPIDADPVGVEVIFGGVAPDPADRGLAVENLRGPGGLAAEPIIDRHPGVVAAGDERHDLPDPLRLVAAIQAPPWISTTTGSGLSPFGVFGQEQVERLPGVLGPGVGDVLLDLDLAPRAGPPPARNAFCSSGVIRPSLLASIESNRSRSRSGTSSRVTLPSLLAS